MSPVRERLFSLERYGRRTQPPRLRRPAGISLGTPLARLQTSPPLTFPSRGYAATR